MVDIDAVCPVCDWKTARKKSRNFTCSIHNIDRSTTIALIVKKGNQLVCLILHIAQWACHTLLPRLFGGLLVSLVKCVLHDLTALPSFFLLLFYFSTFTISQVHTHSFFTNSNCVSLLGGKKSAIKFDFSLSFLVKPSLWAYDKALALSSLSLFSLLLCNWFPGVDTFIHSSSSTPPASASAWREVRKGHINYYCLLFSVWCFVSVCVHMSGFWN